MLAKLLAKRNAIAVFLLSILGIQWLFALILGTSENKGTLLILSLVLPIVTYFFVRLLDRLIGIYGSPRVVRTFYKFFGFVSVIVLALTVAEFISQFPNGFSPNFGAFSGVLIAILDAAKKSTAQ